MSFASIRSPLFKLCIAALATSTAVLVGTYARHVQATDYLKQAEEGTPWVQWGSGTAIVGIVLSFFGNGLSRLAAFFTASLLVVYWYLAGLSLY